MLKRSLTTLSGIAVVSFGLISCNKDPGLQVDSWQLQEPQLVSQETGRLNPLESLQEDHLDRISINDTIQFSPNDVNENETSSIQLQSTASCTFGDTKKIHTTELTLQPKMKLAWFLNEKWILSAFSEHLKGTSCSFHFVAQNKIGSTHSFSIPTTPIYEGKNESPIHVKLNGLQLAANDIVHQNELGSTAIDLKSQPISSLKLICEHFFLVADSPSANYVDLNLFKFENAKDTSLLQDPLREVDSQSCRIYAFEGDLLYNSSKPFRLQFAWPELQLKSYGLLPYPSTDSLSSNSTIDIKKLRLINDSDTPLYARLEQPRVSVRYFHYNRRKKRGNYVHHIHTNHSTGSFTIYSKALPEQAQFEDKGDHVRVKVPPHQAVVLFVSLPTNRLDPLSDFGFKLLNLSQMAYQTDWSYQHTEPLGPFIERSKDVTSFIDVKRVEYVAPAPKPPAPKPPKLYPDEDPHVPTTF